MRSFDLALVARVEQVLPASRSGQLLALEHFLVPAEADRAGVEAAHVVLAHRVLPHRPAVQVGEVIGAVGVQQPQFRRLVVRIARAAPPDVGLRVGRLGAQLRQGLARGLAGLQHLHAGGPGEFLRGQLAPRLVGAADRVDGARLGVQRTGNRGEREGHGREDLHGHLHAPLPRNVRAGRDSAIARPAGNPAPRCRCGCA